MKIKMLIMALLIVSAVNAVKIDVNDVSPQPVAPGADLTLRVAYTNIGSVSERIVTNLTATPPFTLKTSDSPTQFDLCALCSRTVTYFLTVDSSASSGVYPLFLKTGESTTTIDVSVTGRPNLVLFADTLTNITPSERFSMPVAVTNVGSGTAREIKITSRSTDFVTLGGSTIVVDETAPKEADTVIFQMVANDALNAGGYNIQFNIEYLDALGNTYNSTQSIGVQVVNSGSLSVQNIKSAASVGGGPPTAGTPTTVIVRLQNVGHGDIDYIEATTTCGSLTAKTFLGKLEKDEDSPAVFEITFTEGKQYKCNVDIMYNDDLGRHNLNTNFDVNVKGADFPIWIVVLIIAAAGYYFYKKRKHVKK